MEELRPLLEELAKQLGTTVEHLWSVMLYQAWLSAWVHLAQAIIALIVIWFLYQRIKRTDDIDDLDSTSFMVVFMSAVAMGIMSITVFFSLNDLVAKFFNPEYWALQQILEAIGR